MDNREWLFFADQGKCGLTKIINLLLFYCTLPPQLTQDIRNSNMVIMCSLVDLVVLPYKMKHNLVKYVVFCGTICIRRVCLEVIQSVCVILCDYRLCHVLIWIVELKMLQLHKQLHSCLIMFPSLCSDLQGVCSFST